MLYKDKYIIAIYEVGGDETCVGQFDNVRQLAKFINKTDTETSSMLTRRFGKNCKKLTNFITINRVQYEIALVQM